MGLEDFAYRSFFHYVSAIHDDDPVSFFGNNSQVMSNQDHGHSRSLTDFPEQSQNLSLNSNVKCCSRLIGNKKLRSAQNRHSDHESLSLSSAELVGIIPDSVFSRNYADSCHHFCNALVYIALPVVPL